MVKRISCMIFAAAAVYSFAAWAQSYPTKPIRVIVAIAAGSPTDVTMRTAARDLQTALGQPFTIDNRPGGEMMVGSELCARAAPDGYTYCVVSNTAVSINPHIFPKLPYDPDRDFKPVTALWQLIQGIIASASVPANSIRELQALANSGTGTLNSGTMGSGGADLHRRWLNDQWKSAIVGVPYKGANLVMNGLLSGEIQMSLMALGGLGAQIKAGKVKLLVVSSAKRLPQFPDVPTYAEAGMGDAPRTWWALLAPAGTPDAMVRRVNAEIVRLFNEPKFASYLASQFVEPAASSPEEFAALLKQDREIAGRMVRKYNILATE
jgi:tripartite-type tricarboxylate transporter receptor subunit TctC